MSVNNDEPRCKHRHTRAEHPACFTHTEPNKYPNDCVIGIVDVEVLPMRLYSFGIYDQYIAPKQIETGLTFLSWSGKILNKPMIYTDVLTPEEAIDKDDRRITESCWDFMSKCDIIIGHNISGYDKKITNTFFLKHNLLPIKYIDVDTLAVARNSFKFPSNKLDYINKELGIPDKMELEGFELWVRCFNGDPKSLAKMQEYNINDVRITEDLFYRFRPYIKNINLGLYNEIEELQCPVCGCIDLKSEGYYYTTANKWESVRCTNCGALFRTKRGLYTSEKKKSLGINS